MYLFLKRATMLFFHKQSQAISILSELTGISTVLLMVSWSGYWFEKPLKVKFLKKRKGIPCCGILVEMHWILDSWPLVVRFVVSFLFSTSTMREIILEHQTVKLPWSRASIRSQCPCHMSWMSWITPLQGASSFFFSSGRRITVMLLLGIGAAGTPVSPIWSKNLVNDLLYVCLQPHDRGSYTWQVTYCNPWLRYQR